MDSKGLPEQASASPDSDDEDQAVGPTSSSSGNSVRELQGNFEQQQAMIGQLRDMLKYQETSRRQQEKEIEDYATRLAKMKPKLIRGRGRGRTREESSQKRVTQSLPRALVSETQEKLAETVVSNIDEQAVAEHSSPVGDQCSEMSSSLKSAVPVPSELPRASSQLEAASQESGSRTKILLLRKQLEEHRLKFERQQRDNADKKAAMEDMKERIEKLRSEVEQRDELIQSLQDVDSMQVTDPNVQHLYQQIVHKDNTLLDLTDKINQLESIVQDQKEQLEEKEQIISARTEAVSLITKDRDEKMLHTLQQLEELRSAMRQMQHSFTNKDELWTEKEKSLLDTVEEKNKKLAVLEENCHRIEKIRFELSARNAELQEKIVTMQSESKRLKEELTDTKSLLLIQTEETKEVRQKLVRAEAFGQKKLKALEKQVRTISGDCDFSEQILELQNQIAVLEEEKGNLQLKLVDFDEMKLQTEKLSLSIKSTENKLDQVNAELLTQFNAVSQLDKEKILLVEELNAKDIASNLLEENTSKIETQNAELQQSKVTLELRLCALEEERDMALKAQKELENEWKKSNNYSGEELQATVEQLKQIIADTKTESSEKDFKLAQMENLWKESETKAKLMEEEKENKISENQCLISMLAEKENTHYTNIIKIEKLNSRLEELQLQLHSKDEVIEEKCYAVLELEKEIETLHNNAELVKNTIDGFEKSISELNDEINKNYDVIKGMKETEKSLNSVLVEKEKTIMILEGDICSLNGDLEKRESAISDQIQRLGRLEHLLKTRENELQESEIRCVGKSDEVVQQEIVCKKLEQDVINVQKCLKETESKLKAECETLSCLLFDRDNQVRNLEQQVSVKKEELQNNQVMISKFETELCEKNKLYDNLLIDHEHVIMQVSSLESQVAEYSSRLKSSEVDLRNVQEALIQKDLAIEQLQNESANTLHYLKSWEEHSKMLDDELQTAEQKNAELKSELGTTENRWQEQRIEFEASISNKGDEIAQMQQLLSEKEAEIRKLTEAAESSIIEASRQLEFIETWQTQVSDKDQQIFALKDQVRAKNEELYEIKNLRDVDVQHLAQTQNDLLTIKSQNEELHCQLKESSSKVSEIEHELLSAESVKKDLEAKLNSLQSEFNERSALIQHLEASFGDSKEELSSTIVDLLSRLSDNSTEISQLKESYEAQLLDEKQKYSSVLEESFYLKSLYDENQREVDHLRVTCNELQCKLQLSQKLTDSDLKNESVYSDLQSELDKTREAVAELQKLQVSQELEIKSYCEQIEKERLCSQALKLELTELKSKLQLTPSQATDSQVQECHEEFQKENYLLKTQLKEAQQAITQLETILATQSGPTGVAQDEGSDDWGVVDLGEPSFTGSNLSMQTSLIEKDKTLTVIQEQLKSALEQVNTATDDKRLLEHQMNTLEAELSHKDKNIQLLQEQIKGMEAQAASLNQQIHELQFTNAAMQEHSEHLQVTSSEHIASKSGIDTDQEMITSTAETVPVTSSWFASAPITDDFWENFGSDTVGQSGHQFASQSDKTADEESHHRPTEEREQQEDQDQDHHNQETNDDLQYKLKWYEENWIQWTEHYNQLQENYQTSVKEIASLKEQLESYKDSDNAPPLQDESALQNKFSALQESFQSLQKETLAVTDQLEQHKQEQEQVHDITKKLEEAGLEISRLREYETQSYELQGQIQTLQHQCSALENQVTISQSDKTRLHEYEVLYGELQTCIQESETKREGSKSRVQELELMVQSAESEISRLRVELHALSEAGKALENDRNSLQEEIRKTAADRDHFESETERLQREAADLHSQVIDLQNLSQRNESEINQLKSEVEVLEGENERLRSNYEILDIESNRLRNDIDYLTQTNQMLTAQKESLETEIQRLDSSCRSLSSEIDHLRGEMQRLSEVSTSAESEISRLKQEVASVQSIQSEYQDLELKYRELQNATQAYSERPESKHFLQELQLEEVDWGTEGTMEDEHLQRSSSVERGLQEEVEQLKQKVIDLERERNQIDEDLQTSKLRNGKMIQKLKAANNKAENFKIEIDKVKSQKRIFSDLDQAVEEEFKAQVMKAESERDELKTKLQEIERERDQLVNKLNLLAKAEEKFIEMKELQDASMRQLSAGKKNLESQVATLEWKISEMEENFAEQKKTLSLAYETQADDRISSTEVQQLKQTMSHLEQQLVDMTAVNLELRRKAEELETRIQSISAENTRLQALLQDLHDSKSKAESEIITYKNSFLEIHNQQVDLQEAYKNTEVELEQERFQHAAIKAAYNVLYEDYQHLKDERDSLKYELGISTGEKEKLQEEIQSLNNQLEALKEEEEEEIIRALQDECSDLREQNNALKDELIRMGELLKQTEETTERTKHSLDQQDESQTMLRSELLAKSEQSQTQQTKLEEQERDMTYLKAEIAALRAKSVQQEQALEEMEPKMEDLKDKLAVTEEQNKHLKKQVELADTSLMKLATQSDASNQTGVSSGDEYRQPLSVAAASELEAALTSLHLRDLRCQQLSLEINKLLEERDSLQLKLSASLRQNQELSRELSQSQQLPAPTIPPPSLAHKLAELRDLNSSLEKKAVRSFGRGGMGSSLSSLPPTFPTFVSHTAPSTPTATRHANYTVTRESQGSSSTLMDWILGKSTPKEVLHV